MKAESRVANLITRADWLGVVRTSEITVAMATAASLLKTIFILHDVLINFSTSNYEVRIVAVYFFISTVRLPAFLTRLCIAKHLLVISF